MYGHASGLIHTISWGPSIHMGFHMTHGHQIRGVGSNVDAWIGPPRESGRRQNSLWKIGNPKLNAHISKLRFCTPKSGRRKSNAQLATTWGRYIGGPLFMCTTVSTDFKLTSCLDLESPSYLLESQQLLSSPRGYVFISKALFVQGCSKTPGPVHDDMALLLIKEIATRNQISPIHPHELGVAFT